MGLGPVGLSQGLGPGSRPRDPALAPPGALWPWTAQPMRLPWDPLGHRGPTRGHLELLQDPQRTTRGHLGPLWAPRALPEAICLWADEPLAGGRLGGRAVGRSGIRAHGRSVGWPGG